MNRNLKRSDILFNFAPKAATGYKAIVEFLMREIALGTIVSGDKLPPERVLADQLGVARETLRQALRVLEGSGQIEIKRGATGGAIILAREISQEEILYHLRSRKDEISGIIEFRRILEPQAAALAAERRTEKNVAQMEAMQESLLRSTNVDEARRADTAFHAEVAKASGNYMVENVVEDSRVMMFAATDVIFFEFETQSSYDAHAKVLQAIKKRDPQAANDAMEEHIRITEKEFANLIKTT